MSGERRKQLGKDLTFWAIASIFAFLTNLTLSQRLDWSLAFVLGWGVWVVWRVGRQSVGDDANSGMD